ncbi:MAG: geranylgeranylglycerol-phosphate geranylgeranyltransferase [Ignavibacteriales bacterium]|nr:geranylgeranylglycerol-phosphate geranylgeranyltransferase [Ignavibacteriales bacterium]
MNSEKLKALFELTRPLNCVIAFLSIVAASVLAGGRDASWLPILIAGLVGAFVAAGANAINDYFDVEIDRINRPERPIPRNAVAREDARFLWFILSFFGLGLNVFLNRGALAIAFFAVISLYLYSLVLKKTVLVGNFVVALMTGMAFVYGAVVVGKPERSLVPAVFAFLINLAREIVKDVEDMEGDASKNAMTFAVKYGARSGIIVASVILILLVGTTIAAYVLGIYNILYLYAVLVVDVILAYIIVSMWNNRSPINLRRMSNLLKLNMAIGLAAIFAGS